MEIIGDYILIENINELRKNMVWENNGKIRVSAIGIFHNVNQVAYPCAFKYFEYCDSHCCGEYFPCSPRRMAQDIKIEIVRLNERIEELNNILDILESEESE